MSSPKQDCRIQWWRTDLGDREIRAVSDAIRARHINQGPICEELERSFAQTVGAPYAVATTSASVALMLALLAAGVGPGDEVLVPAATFIATAHAAHLIGARVRLVDVEAGRPVMSPEALKHTISDSTKVVIVVHLGGCVCDMESIGRIAAHHGATVLEDAAQALGSKTPEGWVGATGRVAAFSLGITKLITGGEGGLLTVPDGDMRGALARLRNHGVDVIADNVFTAPGGNFRLTDLQAAMALVQLQDIERRMREVVRVRRTYEETLSGLDFLRFVDVRIDDGELPLWTQVYVSDRARVMAALHEAGIASRAFHPVLAESPHLEAAGHFPNAERAARQGLTLPSGPSQTAEDLQRTAAVLHSLKGELPGLDDARI